MRASPANPIGRVRYPRATVRGRLTALYGGMFLVFGIALLAITYLLVVHSFPAEHPVAAQRGLHGLGGTLPNTNGPIPPRASPSAMTAVIDRYRSDALHHLLVTSLIALASITVIAVLLGWIVAGRVLRPLRTITATTQQISEQNLDRRLALTGPNDELKHLGDTIDALLARLHSAFDAQRRFVANASHELRTPVTVGCTLLEMVLDDPHPTIESFRAACSDVLEAEQQQAKRIEALLTLAQGQAGLDRTRPLDLAALARDTLDAGRPHADQRQIALETALAPAPTAGDPALIERLIANLLDNALRYNSPGGHVKMATATATGCATLTIANTGPLVPDDALAQLFQPFHRLVGDRTVQDDGTGLGLSIVQAIADAHSAAIDAQPQPTGGLKVSISFPTPEA